MKAARGATKPWLEQGGIVDNFTFQEGNITRAPEMRHTAGGKAVANFGLAVNRTWFDQTTNDRREEVTFYDVEVWGQQAENLVESCDRGSRVTVSGRFRLNKWETDTGEKRQKLVIVAQSIGVCIRFGTTTFTKNAKPGSESAPITAAEAEVVAGEEPF